MSEANRLQAISFPLYGSRLIEASAGTGKTWTIAALYIRLILGHGGTNAFVTPLLPAQILVMTFTRAATRELSDRIRARLLQAARCFRDEEQPAAQDIFLQEVLASYDDATVRSEAAHRLAMAADAMDDAAVFTIDAWCQRMLREHAFDSGNLFNESLLQNEDELLLDATRDYWREHVYQLDALCVEAILDVAPTPARLARRLADLLRMDERPAPQPGFFETLRDTTMEVAQLENATRAAWLAADERLQQVWEDAFNEGWLNNRKYTHANSPFAERLQAVRAWAAGGTATGKLLETWLPSMVPTDEHFKKTTSAAQRALLEHPWQAHLLRWLEARKSLPALRAGLLIHAADWVAQRMSQLKKQQGVYSFADMLQRLDHALSGPNGATLRERILAQYPVALIDEFQDTSPRQYRIFDQLYRAADNNPAHALLLIGDPKQSIYGFRGADIHSYLQARRATAGRHYVLDTNFRSTAGLVRGVNRLFEFAEQAFEQGAFRFRVGDDNPLPFESVNAAGRAEQLVHDRGAVPPVTIWHGNEKLPGKLYQQHFAGLCAEEIVTLLNDPTTGFSANGSTRRLEPADIAILVRSGKEAAVVRRALQQRGVASVYLSDSDSVFDSPEAADLLRWLIAVADPLDGHRARAAWATAMANLDLPTLTRLASDDLEWEKRLETLKDLRQRWKRYGVLAMVRDLLHTLRLPARLLAPLQVASANAGAFAGAPAKGGGERRLTNLLHLAELLQHASQQLEGEQALIRWFAEQITGTRESGDEKIVRLESDADLVKVVTVHKSKGLEYALVFMPFATTWFEGRDATVIRYLDAAGQPQLDFDQTDHARAAADIARLQEDLRLFYVATTRARHALWLGVNEFLSGRSPRLQRSAIGYLLAGGKALSELDLAEALQQLKGETPEITLQAIPPDEPPLTRMAPRDNAAPLVEVSFYQGQIDTRWQIASFSGLIRDMQHAALAAPETARDETLQEAAENNPGPLQGATDEAPWHQFPRGALPGTLLHDQLEWLASEGFALVDRAPEEFAERLGRRCERLGWANRKTEVTRWLSELARTPLQPINTPLTALTNILPEMEFWFPNEQISSQSIDALCTRHLLGGQPRPHLAERELRGMIKGYCDLVFEHEGRYWILDYKSNALGAGDADYTIDALERAMAAHRYDVQAALYMLALHRLLQQRLGPRYRPQEHLGGAIYLFMRGIKGPQRGSYVVPADLALLEQLDHAMREVQP
ncbi:exodeoxyribonuclease V subunit beta [Silvimonas amylolytica]|uniref:RecBCD enzyme subunit RecB n=1 Tax=Silvimonas amylolytica TaxID=449663 RepID=A0ABQ2PMB6_9NEIS|nr:exodeoxyribonuclease V subunit beta [Silvimonas amylolytica]GGP26418.1 RecBCD enzyme subunit RecB [Silvimonas amylolytica]